MCHMGAYSECVQDLRRTNRTIYIEGCTIAAAAAAVQILLSGVGEAEINIGVVLREAFVSITHPSKGSVVFSYFLFIHFSQPPSNLP